MRKQIARVLSWQAQRYLHKSQPTVVVVTGSVGKTSTTQAIATVLGTERRVRTTIGNYNTDVGVPCSIFGRKLPAVLHNPLAWLVIFVRNEFAIRKGVPFDTLVLELGTDTPGEIAEFAWLPVNIAVVTAVAAEHMEYFKTLDAVAREELAVAKYAEMTIVNRKMVGREYLELADTEELFLYGRDDVSKYDIDADELLVIGEHSVDAITAAAAVARELKLPIASIQEGMRAVRPQPGRMQQLVGLKNTILIDDTYNASPEAVLAGLDYLYGTKAPQRIALLGNMNELGETSEEEHRKIGAYCQKNKLDLVVTLGPDANEFIAPEAKDRGCHVAVAKTPYQAAEIIARHMKKDAAILLKGSQNKVFAEEATKLLLKNPEDEKRLVRQSKQWLKTKKKCFAEDIS